MAQTGCNYNKMSRLTIISKIVASQTAVEMDLRIIMMPLYPATTPVVKTFYGYYKTGGLRIEHASAEGNIILGDLISSDSKTALMTALNAAVSNVSEATLLIHQIGSTQYTVGYKLANGIRSNVTLTGSYFTNAEEGIIKSAILSAITVTQSGWLNRKSFIVNSSSVETEYPVTLTIYNTTGTDSAGVIYISNKVRSDWGDIRILNSSLVALPYAIVKSDSTSITVTLSGTLAVGNNTFYLQYNRPATSGSVTKYGVTTDQHYDAGEVTSGRDQALVHMDNFITEMTTYTPNMILEGGDKVGAYADQATRLLYMQAISDKHAAAATASGASHYKWGWGNHEFDGNTFAEIVAKYGGEPGLESGTLYGYWEDSNYRYISMDANYQPSGNTHLSTTHNGFGYVNPVQLTWLTATLASATKPCIILIHQPICEMDTERIFLTKETYHTQNRVAIRAILEASGKVLFCLSGHTHITAVNIINGIPYLDLADLNNVPTSTVGWDAPTGTTGGKWGKIEIDRDTLQIRFIQEVKVSTTVQTVYNFVIPYKTIYDTDYGNNPPKVLALGYTATYNKPCYVQDASDLYINDDIYVVAKPAAISAGDPRLSDRTIKIYGLTSAANYGRLNWYFAPQTGKFSMKFSVRLATLNTMYFKLIDTSNSTPAIYVGFKPDGNFVGLNGVTSNNLFAYSINNWYEIEVRGDVAANNYSVLSNGSVVASGYAFYSANTTVKGLEIVTETGIMYLDFLRVEKLAATAPTHVSVGSEQYIN